MTRPFDGSVATFGSQGDERGGVSFRSMTYYGVASRVAKEVIGLYATRAEAEEVVAHLIDDVPELADDVFITEIEFETPSAN